MQIHCFFYVYSQLRSVAGSNRVLIVFGKITEDFDKENMEGKTDSHVNFFKIEYTIPFVILSR